MMRAVKQAREAWSAASRNQRAVAATAALLVAAVAALMPGGASDEPWCDLSCPGEDRSRAAALADGLDKGGIAYRLGDGGRCVQVRSTDLPKAVSVVLECSKAHQPDEGAGTLGGLFGAGMGFATGRSRRDVELRRREEEVARTIALHGCVRSVRVHVTRPDDGLFAGKAAEPTASVFLQLVPGRRLAPAQVLAIRDLVAGSVEGLHKHDVTISDTEGTDYASLLGGGPGRAAELDLQGRIEATLSQKICEHLECMFGAGHVKVSVAARVDVARLPAADGAEPTLRARFVSLSTAGVVTAEASLPAPRPASSVLDAVSGVRVAVLVDSSVLAGGKLPERLARTVLDCVRTVAGVDEGRGDRVVLREVPFSLQGTVAETGPARADPRPLLAAAAPGEAPGAAAGLLAVVCLAGLFALLAARQRAATRRRLAQEAAALSGAFNLRVHGRAGPRRPDWDTPEGRAALVRGAAEREPEVVAKLIRTIRLDQESD